ncbi:MAG: hypothetical protein Satyrvirus30_11, partial [Satyrvirus sp.]
KLRIKRNETNISIHKTCMMCNDDPNEIVELPCTHTCYLESLSTLCINTRKAIKYFAEK